MEVRVIYHDMTGAQQVTLIEKKYSGLSNALIPKVGEELMVYSHKIEESIQVKVIEIRKMVERDCDQFDILIEQIN